LALVYNSRAGNGYLGVGWTLSGLSAIYRCNKTFAQDGAGAAVTLTESDGYCLDGQRLRLTSTGNYGQDTSTYQTELANFSNVTAYGGTGSGNTGGPAYFIVQLRNGLTYEYGNAYQYAYVQAGSTGIASMWLLDKVTDRAGNTMSIVYCPTTTHWGTTPANCPSLSSLQGLTVPASVSWTPSSYGSSTYDYSVTFQYSPSPLPTAPTAGYVSGTPAINSNLMTGVLIQDGTTTVKNYEFAYTTSPTTGREQLTALTECADAGGTDCLAPTIFNYQSGQLGVTAPSTAIGSGQAAWGTIYTADIDGDGKADLIYATWNGSTYQWWVQLATASGFLAPVNTGAVTATTGEIVIDDFTGSGKSELLAPNGSTWYAYSCTGTSCSYASTGGPVEAAEPNNQGTAAASSYASADSSGNGMPNLFWANNGTLYELPNTSVPGSTTVSFGSSPVPVASGLPTTGLDLYGNNSVLPSSIKHMDFDGDGRQDLLFRYLLQGGGSYGNQILLSRSDHFVFGIGAVMGGIAVPVNWNNDHCTDLAGGNYGIEVYISGCDGSTPQTIYITTQQATGGFAALDLNADGQTDLIFNIAGSGHSNCEIYTAAANANGYTDAGQSNVACDGVYEQFGAFDKDGDGLDDLWAQSYSDNTITYGLHNEAGLPPDLLTNVKDGYGNA
jgi:hypothetical protein